MGEAGHRGTTPGRVGARIGNRTASNLGVRNAYPGRSSEAGSSQSRRSSAAPNSNDWEEHFEKIKLVPSVPQLLEPKLEDIILNIDMSKFKNLTEASRDLRLTLVKCCKAKRYDIIPLKLLSKLLRRTAKEIPEIKVEIHEEVVCVSSAGAPRLFYLRLGKQKDRFFMITHFLTDMITNNKIQNFNPNLYDAENLVGMIVTVPWAKENVFARAIIRSFDSDFCGFRVYYIDYGDVDSLNVSRLYECPPEIAQLPPFCFPAQLEGLDSNYFETGAASDSKDANVIFNQLIIPIHNSEYCEFQCSVVGSTNVGNSDNDGIGLIYQVRLLNKEKLDIGIELEKMLKKQKEFRDNRGSRPSCEDIGKFLYLDCEVNVRDYEDSFRALKLCKIAWINSPGEFYVRLVGFKHELLEEMQWFYKDPANLQLFKIKTSRVFKTRCYVWYDEFDHSWNRVRVVNPAFDTSSGKRVLAWALDHGCYVEAALEDLKELNPKFSAFPAMSFRAHLVHVKPIPADGGSGSDWTIESNKFLYSMSSKGEKEFYYITLEKETIYGSSDLSPSPRQTSHGIILAEKWVNNGTVQAAFIKAGFGVPTGPSCGRHDLIFTSGVPCYNREEVRRQVEVKSEYFQTQTEEGSVRDGRSNFRAQATTRMTQKRVGEKLAFAFAGFPELFREPSAYDHILQPMQFRMGYIAISSTGSGPGNFCIQMENKMAELNLMAQDLAIVAQNLPGLAPMDIVPGMFTIAKPVDCEKYDFYGRAVITAVNPFKDMANAVFVDYGFEVRVNLDLLRRLPDSIAKVPPFCHRVHLDFSTRENAVVPSELDGWSLVVELAWSKCITLWQEWKPIYYCWQVHSTDSDLSQNDKCIQLEEIDQPIHFDRESLKWHAGPLLKTSRFAALNLARDHPLLKQFYKSVGITIDVEMKASLDEPYKFKPLWQSLMEHNQIVKLTL